MAITTPLMDEILQHFARVFPMPGRIDGREDYLALVKTWADQLEPYSDEQVKEACRRLMGKLKRFPYPSDVRDELAPASVASTTVASLSVEIDTSQIDAALLKVEQLRKATKIPTLPEKSSPEVLAELLEEIRAVKTLLDVIQKHIKWAQCRDSQSLSQFS